MVEIIVTIALEVARCLAPSAGRQISYLRKYKSNFENLTTEVEKLKDRSRSIQREVDAAGTKLEEIEENVQKWLERAEEIEKNVQKLLQRAGMNIEEAAARKTREDGQQTALKKQLCFKGLCPDLKTRYQLGKEAVTQLEAVVKHLGAGSFDKISYPTIPKDPRLSNKDYQEFESRMSTLNDVIGSLSNPDVNIVGIYGMGGIGKTTLAKEVGNQSQNKKLFVSVIFVEVTQNPDILKIQKEIAEKLGLSFYEKESEWSRAGKLHQRLKDKKTNLIILDNIWDHIDLHAIGIPLGDGCKVLLTARSVEVLSGQMDSQANFPVGFLTDEEAWSLFNKINCDKHMNVEGSELKSVATQVAKKCAGLPIAIATVARALRNKGLFVWEDALQQMRMSSSENIQGVHASIELSYNHLESEVLKKTILLIGYTNLTSIDELLTYGMGLGLFDAIKNVEGRLVRVRRLVQQLKDSGLLLESNSRDEDFSMHDVVRDAAIAIASRDRRVITNELFSEFEWPDEDTLKVYPSIVLKDVKSGELPQVVECQQLKLLSISAVDSDSDSFIISDSDYDSDSLFISAANSFFKDHDEFFSRMTELKVLVLADMHLSSLPSSLRCLSSLQALGLYNCQLDDIAVTGDLKKLEILSLKDSNIRQLPVEIGHLTRLKSLDLRDCKNLKVIPPNVISSLSHLEELYTSSFSEWEEEGHDKDSKNASLDELKHLSNLTCLEIQIQDAKALPRDLLFKNLQRYKVAIGNPFVLDLDADWHRRRSTRELKLSVGNANIFLNNITQLKGIEDLSLRGLQDMKSVLYGLGRDGFLQLKYLHLQVNNNLSCIVDSMEYVTRTAFPLLQSLILRKLNQLEKICRGQVTGESFRQLRKIEVADCDQLEKLFPFSVARRLEQLQSISVKFCKNMKEIFAIEGEDECDNKIELCQLRTLTLYYLPKFRSFCSKLKTPSPSPERQDENEITLEDDIEFSDALFTEEVALPQLEDLELSRINVEILWQNQVAAMSCGIQNLAILILRGCANLRSVFTSSIASSLVQLQHLVISECHALEETVVVDARKNVVFPKLRILRMESLENLTNFCSLDYIEFPSLEKLEIIECPKWKEFMVKNNAGVTDLTEIPVLPFFNEKVAANSSGIQNLTSLMLTGCNSTRYLFTSSIASSLVQLQRLQISECQALEEIVVVNERKNVKFPQLQYLEMKRLENLTKFCSGDYIEFPPLKELRIWSCPQLKEFMVKNSASITELTEIPLPFFNEKVALPNLEALDLDFINVERIWENQVTVTSSGIRSLRSLSVSGNGKIRTLFPGNMYRKFWTLETLDVRNCGSLEVIFDVEGPNFEVEDDKHSTAVSPLSKLSIVDLRKLKHVWNKDPRKLLSFPKLNWVSIFRCDRLKNVFPASFASNFSQLESLSIYDCGVEEIAETNPRFVFSRLVDLRLCGLPKFTGIYTTEWPALKQLEVTGWEMVMNLNLGLQQESNKMKQVFPNLEILTVTEKVAAPIWVHHLFDHCNLKYLNVRLDESTDILSLDFLVRFNSMKMLLLAGFHLPPITKTKKLMLAVMIAYLNSCCAVMHILKEESNMDNLVHLRVFCCDNLVNLVPSSTSFPNLTTLKVNGCATLTNILTSSTAKSLVRLREMTIDGCNMITEIVAAEDEGDEAKDYEIVFSELKKLHLETSKSLTSFCCANYTFKFPSLEELTVVECPKMKSFSGGELSTPKLHQINQHWNYKAVRLKNDLNTTIQQLHKEMTCSGEETDNDLSE